MRRPISILIFRDPNDVIYYRAYVPREYNSDIISDAYMYDSEYYRFMDAIYTDIYYDPENPIINQTNYGKFLEHHTRWIDIDIQDMNQSKVYFSLYENQHTNYLCIHRNSPVYFDVVQADNYANIQTELVRGEADLIIV